MGIYLVHCDQQQAQVHWNRWLQSERSSSDYATHEAKIIPVGSENDPRILLSIQFKPKKGTRIGCLGGLLFTCGLGGILIFVMLSFLESVARSMSLFLILIFLLSFLFVLLITSFSPFLTLMCYEQWCAEDEVQLIRDFVHSGIDAAPLTKLSQCIWFSGEAWVLMYVMLSLVSIEFFGILGILKFIALFLPILLISVPQALVDLSLDVVHRNLVRTSSPYNVWKLAVLRTSREIYYYFASPFSFYMLIYITTQFFIIAGFVKIENISLANNIIEHIAIALNNVDISNVLNNTDQRYLNEVINSVWTKFGSVQLGSRMRILVIFLVVGFPIGMFFQSRSAWKNRNIWFYDVRQEWGILPSSPGKGAGNGDPSTITNICIILNLCWFFTMTWGTYILLGLTILWMFHGNIAWVPAAWIAPLVWYEVLIGDFFCRLFLIMGFAFSLLWLAMWFYSQLNSSWQLLVGIFNFGKKNHRAELILHKLCQEHKIAPPLLRIDKAKASLPTTIPILPFSRYCVIHLSESLISEITDQQLTLILAHELAHATVHVRKLWFLQLVSRITFLGAGYLTLLLDYRKMELEADEYAVRITGGQQAFLELLEALPKIEIQATRSWLLQHQNRSGGKFSPKFPGWIMSMGLVQLVKDLYRFHFSYNLWGSIHPSHEERIVSLRSQITALSEQTRYTLEFAEEEAKQLGRYSEALANFDQAISLDSSETIANRGETYRLMGRYREALADFDRAIALDGQYKWAIGQRGETYHLMGRYTEALADFDRAIALDGQYKWAIRQRGETFRLMGRYWEALADFDRAIALDEQYAWAIASRGQTYQAMKCYQEALADFDRAIALDKKLDWAIASRGETYHLMGRYTEALADFDRAIALDGQYKWAIGQRGETFRLMGRYREALADFDRAIALDEQYAWAIASRGQTYQAMKRYQEALTDFDRAIALDEKLDWAIASRGQTYQAMKRYQEALADFDRAIALDKKLDWAIASRGQTYQAMKRYQEALADFDRAIALDGQYKWAIGQRGETFRLMGRYTEALADFDRAIALDEQYTQAIASRGQVYKQLSHYTEALADFDRAIALDGQYKWAIGQRGQTYRLMGCYAEALTDFNRAIALDEQYAWAFAQREEIYRLMSHPTESLTDFDRAIAEETNVASVPITQAVSSDRFDKFTERAKKVLSLAEVEAQSFQHNYIDTEHLLLGLVCEGEGVAAKVLANFGIEPSKVRSAVEYVIGRGDRIVLSEIGLTPGAKEVIELAVDEAHRLNHHFVGTEHLLLGLIREGEGVAAGILESLGVNLENVRTQTIQTLG